MGMFFNRPTGGARKFSDILNPPDWSIQERPGTGIEPYVEAGERLAQQVDTPAQPQRPSLGREIVGRLGDALSQWGGGQPIYGLQQEQQRKMEAFAAQQQAQRAAEFADWERKERWKRDNPEPIGNDTVNDYNFRVQTLGKAAADEWLRNAGDPIVTVQLPGNRVYSGPRSGMAAALGAGSSTTRPEIGAVVADPRRVGGPTPTASAGFRP